MNIKFFVPFETAKLLKKRGYPQSEEDWYYMGKRQILMDNATTNLLQQKMGFDGVEMTAAPTYHEVLDWFEEKGITIEVKKHYVTGDDDYGWKSYIQRSEYDREFVKFVITTREEALNAAIIKALEK